LRCNLQRGGASLFHGDRIPRLLKDQKLLEKSVRFVVHRFGTGTDSTQSAVVLDINRKSWPVVMLPDLVECFCLTELSCKGVIM